MRAIVFAEPGTFSLEEVPDPAVGPQDVLVRVEAVGICGTDLHVLDGEFAPTVFPIIPGHETSGIVEAVGDQVGDSRPATGFRWIRACTAVLRLLQRWARQLVRELGRVRGRPDQRLDR